MPAAQFSPDGAALVAWGTARIVRQDDNDKTLKLDASGIDLFAPLSGRIRGAFRLYEDDFPHPIPQEAVWTRQIVGGKLHSIFHAKDERSIAEPYTDAKKRRSTRNRPIDTLRFFDTMLAREVGYLDMSTPGVSSGFNIEELSTDDNGRVFLFGQGNYGLASRTQLGTEKFGALPQPTPRPTLPPERLRAFNRSFNRR